MSKLKFSISPRKRIDLGAGLTVSLLLLPQAMAYALVAGVPLSAGLLSAIFGTAIVAVFGSSRHLITGPTNATAILLHAGLAELLYLHFGGLSAEERGLALMALLGTTTLLMGFLQIGAAVLHLGRLTYFVSRTVVLGYLLGAVSAVTVGQMFVCLQIEPPKTLHSIAGKVVFLLEHLSEYHLASLILALVCLALLLFLRARFRKAPHGLIMIACATVVSALGSKLGWQWMGEIALVGDMGEVVDLTPELVVPMFSSDMLRELLPLAFATAVLGIVETTSVARAVAVQSGQHPRINREILGIGMANFVTGWFGSMPSSGSPSRTALNYEAGAVSRASAIFAAGWVFVMILLFGWLVVYIPLVSLAALLLVSVAKVIKPEQLWHYLTCSRSSALTLITTFAMSLFLSLDVAFYTGVTLSTLFKLRRMPLPEVVG